MLTIHFELTDLIQFARSHTTLTGIQRVLIQILSEMVNAHGPDRIRVVGYHPTRNRFASWDASYFAAPFRYDQADFCSRFGIPSKLEGIALRSFVERKYGSRFVEYHCARLRLKNALTGGREFRRRGDSAPLAYAPPALTSQRQAELLSQGRHICGWRNLGIQSHD